MPDEVVGRAKGGKAVAAKMTPEQRKERAQKAISARWARVESSHSMPEVLHKGDLRIADVVVPCAVVDMKNGKDPIRVITENGITNALLGTRSGASKRLKKKAETDGPPTPLFLAPSQLKPFIDNDLYDGPLKCIEYVDGNRTVSGYDATALPIVCDIWLRAREAGKLQKQQLEKAQKAEILTRSLAKVAIIALVDEATGYQSHRAKDALAIILEQFIAKELQPYVKTFPPEFYEELFRLRGLKYPPETPNFRPQYFGTLTNDIVYERLAPGLLEEMKRQAAKDAKKAHLHRRLTQEVGHPKLREHLAAVIMAMRMSSDYPSFIATLNRFYPRFGQTYVLDLEQIDR